MSAVGIPANPNALQLGLKAGAIEKRDLEELMDWLRRAGESAAGRHRSPTEKDCCSERAAAPPHTHDDA